MKITKSQTELEAILLSLLRSRPDCSEALKVSVFPLQGAEWTITAIDPGGSPFDKCLEQIGLIVPLVQQQFELEE